MLKEEKILSEEEGRKEREELSEQREQVQGVPGRGPTKGIDRAMGSPDGPDPVTLALVGTGPSHNQGGCPGSGQRPE